MLPTPFSIHTLISPFPIVEERRTQTLYASTHFAELRITEYGRIAAVSEDLKDLMMTLNAILHYNYKENLINILKLFILFITIPCSDVRASAYAAVVPATKTALSYADIADLANAAPLIAIIRVQGVKNIELALTESPKAKIRHHLITAKIDSLIRGDDGFAPKVTFLVDSAAGGEAKKPAILPGIKWRRGMTLLIYARPGIRAGEVQLVSRNAAQIWSKEIEATTREVTSELLGANPPPPILGVGDVFHVAGTIADESETQIFLNTATGAPVSLSILRRPGEAARWGVSLGEIVDDAAIPPPPRTLLWYRLACSLPDTLPAVSVRNLSVLDAEAARSDYRFVIESLGSCGRTL